MVELGGLDEFGDQVSALEDSMAGAQTVAAAFAGQMQDMRSAMADTSKQVASVSTGVSRGLRGAFDGLIFDGMKLSDAMTKIGASMLSATYSAAVTPVTKQLGQSVGTGLESLISGMLPFADGAGFSQGRVMPFANGGVVTSPVAFPMRGATGLMGEAGPEAIMPLTRGADGSLGVRSASGAQQVSVVMNVSTPDATSFRRSQGQIAAQMGRALGRGQRNR